jgi:hypothetical protein
MCAGVLLLAASCSSNPPGSDDTASNPPSTTTSTSSQTTTTTAPPQFAKTADFTLTYGMGYTASAVFRLGNIQPLSQMQVAGVELASACGTNPATTAVIPWELSVTNTTPSFSFSTLNPTFSLTVYSSSQQPGGGAPATTTGGGVLTKFEAGNSTQCVSNYLSGYAAWSLGELQPNQTTNLGGFFIVTQYDSPAQPNGSPSEIDQMAISIFSVRSNGDAAQMTPSTGSPIVPEQTLSAPGTPSLVMPLDAAQSTNCSMTEACTSSS